MLGEAEAAACIGGGVVPSRCSAVVSEGEEGVLEEGCPLVRRIRKEQHQIDLARI